MTKKVLTILLTALLFLSALTLGCANVFRVGNVAMVATVVSEESKEIVAQLKEEVFSSYKDRSIFSVKQKDVKSILDQYPYFRVVEFKKVYPSEIIITIEEEAEVYAVEKSDGEYYILGETGAILEVRSSSKNRLDKADNVLVKGLTVDGERGGFLKGDDCWETMFLLCKTMHERLGGIRSNVQSVEVLSRSPETFYVIRMREGLNVYVGAPSVMTVEKAKSVMDKYMALSDAERMTGRLTVRDSDGEVFVSYSAEDEFEY